MGKRGRPREGRPGAHEPAGHRPFAGLKGAFGAQPMGSSTSATARSVGGHEPVSDEDLALFRREVRGTRRLRDDNRHPLERPKPPPTTRPRGADGADGDESARSAHGRLRRPRTDAELFAEAMAGVRRLANDNRVELPSRACQRPRTGSESEPRLDAPPPDEATSTVDLLDWAHAGATPLKDDGRVDVGRPKPAPLPLQSARDEQSVLRESIETPLSFEDHLDIGDEALFLRSGLPRRILGDLRRGRWVVQGQLDLHGMTRDEARLALAEFLCRCLREGRRCVRLIHGKGLGSPGGVGVLKQLSRGWLAQREEILAFCQALPHQGGSGALVILLRVGGVRPAPRSREPAA